MPSLFIATGNAHKVGEIRGVLGPTFRVQSPRDTGWSLEVEETGDTFAANACLKAVTWAAYFGTEAGRLGVEWVLADDSGLEVDALNGAPGVHSARFAARDDGQPGNSPDSENNAKLLHLLKEVPAGVRTARFRCVLAMTPVRSGKSTSALTAATLYFDGTCEGRIQMQATGRGGFGYDPLFVPEGYGTSFAELGDDVKNSLSHRGRALKKLAGHFEVQKNG